MDVPTSLAPSSLSKVSHGKISPFSLSRGERVLELGKGLFHVLYRLQFL